MALVTRVKVMPPSVETDTPEPVGWRCGLVVDVSDDYLVGVIRVAPGECRRLVNVGKRLGAGDQVNVRPAIHQRKEQLSDKSRQGTEGNSLSPASLRLAAGYHDGAGPEIHLLIDAQLENFGTIKSVRDQRVFGVGDDLILLLRLCDARVSAENAPRPASHRKTPAITTNTPIKRRRLKKADTEIVLATRCRS